MNTALIDIYLANIGSKQRIKMLEVLDYVGGLIDNGVLSCIFTLPGYTVDGIPVCNFNIKKDTITMRFFQKDVFDVFAQKLSYLECGRCSVRFENTDDIKTREMEDLIKLTVRTVKVDAAFLKSIRMRDYGYYDNVLLKPGRR